MPDPPQPRRKALAELEAHIARAETTRDRCLQDLAALPAARRAQAMLRQAEERLAQLPRSREALLAGEKGYYRRS